MEAAEKFNSIYTSEAHTLEFNYRILSPSDFGVHNSIRSNDGLVWIDFEYFGWDDPAKMVLDFRYHPRNRFSNKLKIKFQNEVINYFKADDLLPARIDIFQKLEGINWCLILLNEFLPGYALRRKSTILPRPKFLLFARSN